MNMMVRTLMMSLFLYLYWPPEPHPPSPPQPPLPLESSPTSPCKCFPSICLTLQRRAPCLSLSCSQLLYSLASGPQLTIMPVLWKIQSSRKYVTPNTKIFLLLLCKILVYVQNSRICQTPERHTQFPSPLCWRQLQLTAAVML